MQAINKIILGTVQLGIEYGVNNSTGKLNDKEAIMLLNEAYAMGIRIIDTAELYGNAHDLIGKYHTTYPNQLFKVITKFPHDIKGSITQKITRYLKTLKIDKLEGLLFHSYESYKKELKTISLLSPFKNQGIINQIGVSIYTNQQMEEVIKDKQVDVVQLPFNLLDNNSLRGDLIRKAKEFGKIIHTRSAFLQGLIFMPLNSDNLVVRALKNELKIINRLAQTENVDLQELALNYCLQQDNIDNVLVGVDNIVQLKQNLQRIQIPLSQLILKDIDKIKVEQPDLLNPTRWKQL